MLSKCLTIIHNKTCSNFIKIQFKNIIVEQLSLYTFKIHGVYKYKHSTNPTTNTTTTTPVRLRNGNILTASEVDSIKSCRCEDESHSTFGNISLETLYTKKTQKLGCLTFGNRLESDICELYNPLTDPTPSAPIMSDDISKNNTGQKNIIYLTPTLYAEIPHSLRHLMKNNNSHMFILLKMCILIFRIFNLEDEFLKSMETLLQTKYETDRLEKNHISDLCSVLSETDISNDIFIYLNRLFGVDTAQHIRRVQYTTSMGKNAKYMALGNGITFQKLVYIMHFLLRETQAIIQDAYHFQLSSENHKRLFHMVYKHSANDVEDTTQCHCFCHLVKKMVKRKYSNTVSSSILKKQNDMFYRTPMLLFTHNNDRYTRNDFTTHFIPSISTLQSIYPYEDPSILTKHFVYLSSLKCQMGHNNKYNITSNKPHKIFPVKRRLVKGSGAKQKYMKWQVNSSIILRCKILQYSCTTPTNVSFNEIEQRECSFPLFNLHTPVISAI